MCDYLEVVVVMPSTNFQCEYDRCHDFMKNVYLERKPKSRFKPRL